ncbi:MAG TPA: CbiX/SirB N-terminal domain-containing protein [Mycobacteriales bacterium]|nr:CbiX/SirB N-terminal domain-containing protein [Mycobacteriales bacterium]
MTGAPLVLIAHGSTDPRFDDVVQAVAARVRELRPQLEVRVGYLEHGPPNVADVAGGGVLVPLLLASGFHVLKDLPEQAPGALASPAVGPDERVAVALRDRLAEAGYDGTSPVVLAAAGSSDERALDDVRTAARQLAELLAVEVTPAFISAGSPRVVDAIAATPGAAVASYLVAPGAFHDAVIATGAAVVSAPIGDHPAVADVVLSRYDECGSGQPPGRTAPT